MLAPSSRSYLFFRSLCWKRRFDFAILGQIRYATVLDRDYWGTKKMKFSYIYIYIGLIIDTYCTLTRLVSPERRVIKFQ